MSPAELLAEARGMMERPDPTLDGVWARSAALLARQALEQSVRQKLIHEMRLSGVPSFRSQLLALREVVEPELAAEVAWTWSALSSATHHHGYALPPTAGELNRWIQAVERIA